jgi:hypothetical protein
MWQLLFALLLALPKAQATGDISTAASAASTGHPILALGSQAPDFSLPGVDGRAHTLAEYASAPSQAIRSWRRHTGEQRVSRSDL